MNVPTKIGQEASTFSVETLSEPYALAAAVVERFQREGFVKLGGVLAPEALGFFGEEITQKVFELNTEDLPIERRTAFRAALLQVFNLWTQSEVAKELIFSSRLARIATELMGVRGVRLYHDQALYKEPGGKSTPWHADQYYWPFETPNTVTAWIPFHAVPLEMGPLSFSAGSHKLEVGRDLPISEESERSIAEALRERELPHAEEPFELGDVSFHYAGRSIGRQRTRRLSHGGYRRSSMSTPTLGSPSRRATPSGRTSKGGSWGRSPASSPRVP